MTKLTSPKINNFLQLSSGLDVPHPFREFFAVVHHLPLHLFWLTWWFYHQICMTKMTSPKINNGLQVSSEYVYPHPTQEFWPVLNGYANLLLCSLGDFAPKYAWPNWPPSKSTMDSKSLQGVMSHIHSESFDRFCMGKLSIDFVHLWFYHHQDDLPQNQPKTPTFLRAWCPTPIPRVLTGFSWVCKFATLFTWWF